MKSVLEAMTELVSRGYPKDTAYRIANGELPMDKASRDARRREMGYDKKVYHTGAADITEFDPHAGVFDRADTGTFVTDDRILAQTYMDQGKQIYPLYIRDREMPYIDADDAYFSDIDGDLLSPRDELIESFEGASTNEIARFAGEEGLPGVEFRGVKDPGPHTRAAFAADKDRLLELADIFDGGDGGDIPIVYSVQDPTLIRSQFAAFDPQYKGGNILGGTAATAIGAGALMAPNDASADSGMYRSDGSKKSATGYLGPVENLVTGGTMTEFTTEWEDMGIEIPTMVPTLSSEEIEYMQRMVPGQGWDRSKPMDASILQKAKDHARMRLEQGKSPYYQDRENSVLESIDIFEEESPMTYRDRRRDRRQRAQDQRERVSGGDEPLLSGAQTANLLAGLTGVAGVADIFGEYPEFPEGDVSVEEMVLEGQRGPSLAENIGEGNYLSAGLQSLGVLPIVGLGARAAAKALRSADGITSLPINKQIEVMETVREGTKLDAPVFAPKIFEEGGKPDVRRMEAALKSNQGDLSSIDDMAERAQSVNDGFQSNVAEVAEAVGGKKAGKFITLKDGSQFDVEVKSRKSIADKIERKGLTPSEFTDGVRTTIYVDTADQAEEAVQRLGALYPSIDRGWQRLPDTGYFDRKMNLAIEDPKTGGYIVGEIQIKTPEMAEAAIPGHRWYEYSRKLEGRYDHQIPATKIQLYKKALEEQRRLYGEAESVADPEILRQLVEKFKAGGAVASPRRSHRSGIQTLA